MGILDSLNSQQKEAAKNYKGIIVIEAGPGAGKTKTITIRTAYMINKGVNPSSIVLFTFTKKAASEIKNRIIAQIGEEAQRITVGTYHSVCVKLLRQYADYLEGYDKHFSIYDSEDIEKILKELLKGTEIKPYDLGHYIEQKKQRLISFSRAIEEAQTEYEIKFSDLYRRYQLKLKNNNAMDFGDLIYNAVCLLRDNLEVKEKVNKKWKYILSDESHDSNFSDIELIKLLGLHSDNITLIMDIDQCLLPETEIETINGKKQIKDMTLEDILIVAKGRNKIITSKIDEIKKNPYKGKVIKITTETGKTITATPNHIIFGRIEPLENMHYVYLMYKDGYGYRIGRTSSVRTEAGKRSNGFEVRLRQEHGDKIWIIGAYSKLSDAIFYENYYSYQYGIPQYVFKNANKINALRQDEIKKLFNSIDTNERAEQLLKDRMLYIEYPHHMPQANSIGGEVERFKLSFTMFGSAIESKQYFAHELTSCTKNPKYIEILSKYFGVLSYKNGNGCSYSIARKTTPNHDQLYGIMKDIELDMQDKNLTVQCMARLTNKKFNFMPISNLIVGSIVAIKENDLIIEDKIISIETIDYDGFVYDINVPDYRNYIANDIVVHNSIYGFRGASIDAISMFIKEYNPKVYKLEQNYRCSGNILNAAKSLISHNAHEIEKKLFTENNDGVLPIYFEEIDQKNEAMRVLKLVILLNQTYNIDYKDIAVLYRMNYLSRNIEDAFIKAGIKYKLIGKCFAFISRTAGNS